MDINLPSLQGTPFDYIIVFLGGILASFTPCVYPLIPITVGVIGAKSEESRLKGLSLSLIYCLGIAVMYSVLGLIASLTGKLFGEISISPITHIVVGNICILAGLWIMDIFALPAPKIITKPWPKREGYFGVFIIGLFSGLAVSPCITPVLAVILSIVAAKQNIVYGTSLLFVFAYGMGFVLIIAGTFSGLLTSLPKSGKWLGVVKKIYGLVLIGVGEYFLIKGGYLFL